MSSHLARAGLLTTLALSVLTRPALAFAEDRGQATPAASGASAVGAKSIAVVALGGCEASASATYVKALRDALAFRLGREGVQSDAETARPLGGLGEKAVADLERMLAKAREDFFQEATDRSTATLLAALEDVARAAPSEARWKVERDLHTTLALVRLQDGKRADAEKSLTQVLRVEPDYRPDPDFYSPSFRAFVDGVRARVKRRPQVTIEVVTRPAGLPVYVGGRGVGKGPYTLKVPGGDYRVEADFGTGRSLAKQVRVGEGAGSIAVELSRGLEGAVHVDAGPCLTLGPERRERLTALVRLASLVGVGTVISIRQEEIARGEQYLVATAVDAATGEETREAKVKVYAGGASSGAMGNLADFIATGEAIPPVEALKGSVTSSTPVVSAPMTPVAADAPVLKPEPPSVSPPVNPVAEQVKDIPARGPNGARIAAYVAGGVALAGLGVGGWSYVQSTQTLHAISELGTPDAFDSGTEEEFARLDTQLRAEQSRAAIAAGIGGVGLITAVVLFVVSADAPPPPVAVGLGPGGLGLSVAGSF